MREVTDGKKDKHGKGDAQEGVQAQCFKKKKSHEGADHDHGPMGDINYIHHSPGQRETNGNVYINGAQKDSIEKDLQAQSNFSLPHCGGVSLEKPLEGSPVGMGKVPRNQEPL